MSTQKPQAALERTLEEAMANAWRDLASHCTAVRDKQGLLWNRTNSLDILNMFLRIQERLTKSLPGEYAQLERNQVAEAASRFRSDQPAALENEALDLKAFSDPQRSAACWKQVLGSYCRIHGRLRVELQAWNEAEYKEFESTIWNLLKQPRV